MSANAIIPFDFFQYLAPYDFGPCGLDRGVCGTRNAQKMLHISQSSIFDYNSSQSLRILHIHRLHVAIQLLLCTLFVISLP